MTGMGLGATLIPKSSLFARNIPLDSAWTPGDVAMKKALSDVALNAAKSKGATYTDVRIGRYLNQFVITREIIPIVIRKCLKSLTTFRQIQNKMSRLTHGGTRSKRLNKNINTRFYATSKT